MAEQAAVGWRVGISQRCSPFGAVTGGALLFGLFLFHVTKNRVSIVLGQRRCGFRWRIQQKQQYPSGKTEEQQIEEACIPTVFWLQRIRGGHGPCCSLSSALLHARQERGARYFAISMEVKSRNFQRSRSSDSSMSTEQPGPVLVANSSRRV